MPRPLALSKLDGLIAGHVAEREALARARNAGLDRHAERHVLVPAAGSLRDHHLELRVLREREHPVDAQPRVSLRIRITREGGHRLAVVGEHEVVDARQHLDTLDRTKAEEPAILLERHLRVIAQREARRRNARRHAPSNDLQRLRVVHEAAEVLLRPNARIQRRYLSPSRGHVRIDAQRDRQRLETGPGRLARGEEQQTRRHEQTKAGEHGRDAIGSPRGTPCGRGPPQVQERDLARAPPAGAAVRRLSALRREHFPNRRALHETQGIAAH